MPLRLFSFTLWGNFVYMYSELQVQVQDIVCNRFVRMKMSHVTDMMSFGNVRPYDC